MFGRATITLGIGPHSNLYSFIHAWAEEKTSIQRCRTTSNIRRTKNNLLRLCACEEKNVLHFYPRHSDSDHSDSNRLFLFQNFGKINAEFLLTLLTEGQTEMNRQTGSETQERKHNRCFAKFASTILTLSFVAVRL